MRSIGFVGLGDERGNVGLSEEEVNIGNAFGLGRESLNDELVVDLNKDWLGEETLKNILSGNSGLDVCVEPDVNVVVEYTVQPEVNVQPKINVEGNGGSVHAEVNVGP